MNRDNLALTFVSPGRVNFLGEHTDYSGGTVLPAAINLGIRFDVFRTTEPGIWVESEGYGQRIRLSQEIEKKNAWTRYVLSVLSTSPVPINPDQIYFKTSATLPAGAGLSSSSALICGFIYALNQLLELHLSAEVMLQWAVDAEHGTGTMGGAMDQNAIFFGKKEGIIKLDCTTGKRAYIHPDFSSADVFLINSQLPHELQLTPYNDRRLLSQRVWTRLQEKYPSIASLCATPDHLQNEVLNELSPTEKQAISFVWEEERRVQIALSYLESGNMKAFGKLLYQTHWGLSQKYEVSRLEIDHLICALQEDQKVFGARMIGGGFGGCLLVVAEKGQGHTVADRLIKRANQNNWTTPSYLPFELVNGLLAP